MESGHNVQPLYFHTYIFMWNECDKGEETILHRTILAHNADFHEKWKRWTVNAMCRNWYVLIEMPAACVHCRHMRSNHSPNELRFERGVFITFQFSCYNSKHFISLPFFTTIFRISTPLNSEIKWKYGQKLIFSSAFKKKCEIEIEPIKFCLFFPLFVLTKNYEVNNNNNQIHSNDNYYGKDSSMQHVYGKWKTDEYYGIFYILLWFRILTRIIFFAVKKHACANAQT